MSSESNKQNPNPNGVNIEISASELKKYKIFLAVPMYGGMCAGVFTKSVMDLGAMCMHYGLPCQAYFLFNESLITRARNYCVDEFMRSDATHLMFIDSDIGFNPNDVLALLGLTVQRPDVYHLMGGPYPKKSVPYYLRVLTENGYQKIGKLVKEKYSGKVLSLNNKTGQKEWKRVISHSESPANGKRWVKIVTDKNLKIAPVCTFDHECSTIKDILRPAIDYLPAFEMKGKYIAKTLKSKGNLFNSEQISALIGSVLGDGSISKTNQRFSVGHGLKQNYLDYKQYIFGGKINGPYGSESQLVKQKELVLSDGNIEYHTIESNQSWGQSFHLTVPINEQTKLLYKLFYETGKTIKNVLSYIDDIALAFWYMDDGCLKKSGNSGYYCELNTQGFSDEDQQILQNWFKEKFGFDIQIDESVPVAKSKTNLRYKRLRFRNNDADRFFQIISKHIPACMEYKLPPHYREGVKYSINNKHFECRAEIVTDVIEEKCESDQFDVGVEDNFNFVTENGIIFHNCVSWEKIKIAVDKGFADTNPNELEKFVGDYVFNPKGGQTEIPIGAPAEVLELGTGFMMVPKQTCKIFAEAFPEYLYRPDHVRTAHFDGSRKITQFFQAEIDKYDPRKDYEKLLDEVLLDGNINSVQEKITEVRARIKKLSEEKSLRYLSEDYWFSQKIQELGLRAWLCPWMQLSHMGSFIFGGSLADLARIGAPATAAADELAKHRAASASEAKGKK